MCQHKQFVGSQSQAVGGALRGERTRAGMAVELGHVCGVGHLPVGMAGQQDAELFKAFADGGNGLGEVQVALRGAALGVRVRQRIGRIDAAARKHIGPRGKAGGHGAARHQDF